MPIDPTTAEQRDAMVTLERARILALFDVCPKSSLSAALRAAVAEGQTPDAFAIDLARAAKASRTA